MNIQLNRLFSFITYDQTQRRMFKQREKLWVSSFEFRYIRISIQMRMQIGMWTGLLNQLFIFERCKKEKRWIKINWIWKIERKKTFRLLIHKKSLFHISCNKKIRINGAATPLNFQYTVNTGYVFIALIQMYVLSSMRVIAHAQIHSNLNNTRRNVIFIHHHVFFFFFTIYRLFLELAKRLFLIES